MKNVMVYELLPASMLDTQGTVTFLQDSYEKGFNNSGSNIFK